MVRLSTIVIVLGIGLTVAPIPPIGIIFGPLLIAAGLALRFLFGL